MRENMNPKTELSTTTTPLRRSVINRSIRAAAEMFAHAGIALPPFANWSVAEWQRKGPEADEIRDCMLGWDVTDFGSGDFERIGRTLFTLRNGTTRKPGYRKTYAEKLLFDPANQRAPAHYHRSKMEDIICVAGGNMLVQLWPATADDRKGDASLVVKVDGIPRTIAAGETIRLNPGTSVCIIPRTIHQFWGEEGTGLTVSREISSVCDDWNDNVFLVTGGLRFPQILEDEPRDRYLCHEYPVT